MAQALTMLSLHMMTGAELVEIAREGRLQAILNGFSQVSVVRLLRLISHQVCE